MSVSARRAFAFSAALCAVALAPLPASAQPADSAAYRAQAQAELERLRAVQPIDGPARNIIIFIGDGFGVTTLTAARIHQGQQRGVDGESFVTAMDTLPHSALVRTYSHDAQVSDSAPTATAILSGVKARAAVIGYGPEALIGDCASALGNEAPSLIAEAQGMGLATGVVTTTRITHATPAAAYAHTPHRNWEARLPADQAAAGCTDIATQLVEGDVGMRLDVVMGGGRRYFVPADVADPEYPAVTGLRNDGRNLLAEWRARHPQGHYVTAAAELAALDPAAPGPLLALFEPDHMRYTIDRAADPAGEPSLAEMTAAAIARLSQNPGGFVLLVEAGRIDHAHHAGNAARALADAVAMDEAVAAAMALTNPADTLIVTTADHSHVIGMAGYPSRGNPILGLVREDGEVTLADDGMAYTTLGYLNGPGAVSGPRPDPADHDTHEHDYLQQALVPLGSETHGGEDVAVRASGPMAYLFRGTIEQHTIHAIMQAALLAGQ
ncbi:alkaline phosphatase [Altererythrobacter lauratis]|uniref:Alkaline phosphatase n=1 Tax=Alteraurantiacibacter lauratis TaxID=2054627 RepID=A0ABV7EE41_9SPHN